jgi:hypoxanthine phosphoribosyltransferase
MEDRVKMCFVMMPSGNHGEYKGSKEESDFIYQGIIVPALKKVFNDCCKIVREVDSRRPGAITGELIRHIASAEISIVDITGQNPNVFLELGIRYALRRSTTILLRQAETPIPFDIANYRCVEYSSLFLGPAKAIQDIVDTINHVISQSPPPSDSLVFEVFPQMTVEIPGVIKEKEEDIISSRIMAWSEYWDRLQHVVDKLRDNFSDGRFVPHVILGISNGGLMYADLLGRELFKGIPILSLWADRLNKEGKYFDNSINKSILQGIEAYTQKAKEEKEVLLVDDIVASGTTLRQAVLYLKDNLPKVKVYFLPLFSRNEKYFDLIRENIVWLSPVFHFTEKEVIEMHTVEKNLLPYMKEIRST